MAAPIPQKPNPLGGLTRRPIVDDKGIADRDFIKLIQDMQTQITALRKKVGI